MKPVLQIFLSNRYVTDGIVYQTDYCTLSEWRNPSEKDI